MSTEVKTFTTADLAKHNSKSSLYLAVGGKVYDCTEFIDEVRFFFSSHSSDFLI